MDISYLPHKYPNIAISDNSAPHGVCLIDSRVHGLYACFHCILYGLYICEEEAIRPIIVLGQSHLYYDETKGDNIFTYFYKQEPPPELGVPKITVINLGGYLNWISISTNEKKLSNILLRKYFILNENTAAIINDFRDIFFFK